MAEQIEKKERVPSILSKVKLLPGDRVLWVIIVILLVVSLLVVYSSVAKMGYSPIMPGTTASHLRGHFVAMFLSVIALLIVYRIDSKYFRKAATLLYILALVLTVAAYIPGIGREINGAARTISIAGIGFQPSELLKVATILFLAQQLSARQREIRTLRIMPSFNPFKWALPEQKEIWRNGTLPIVVPVVVACAVIVKAHTSSALLVFLISLVMMYIGRVNPRELLKIIAALAIAGALFVALNLGRSETASGRVGTWIEMWTTDRTKVGVRDLTDTDRSMIAIHDGGIVGVGAGRSVMRAKITHPESDYIFAFFVEEYGIILAFFLVLLYLWIFYRAIRIFENCDWIFAGLLELGLALLITIQALLHIMVTINFIPETGQNLPLISHGGSSMICTAIAFGMILSVSRQIEEGTLIPARNESSMEKNQGI